MTVGFCKETLKTPIGSLVRQFNTCLRCMLAICYKPIQNQLVGSSEIGTKQPIKYIKIYHAFWKQGIIHMLPVHGLGREGGAYSRSVYISLPLMTTYERCQYLNSYNDNIGYNLYQSTLQNQCGRQYLSINSNNSPPLKRVDFVE